MRYFKLSIFLNSIKDYLRRSFIGCSIKKIEMKSFIYVQPTKVDGKGECMDIKKFMAEIENKELNYINIDRIEKQIKVKLPYDVRCILSNNFETVSFDNNIRLLSMDEINDLQKDLDVDFVSMGMIPLFDFFDNDFIVYNFKENYFAIYNIIDKILFKKKEKLMDFFLDNLS